jgi:folate-dependent phosphoribosylglycinamide formyltransferase PurN
MKLGILTSIETRHRYFANQLCDAFDTVAVGHEQVDYSPVLVDTGDLSAGDAAIVENHFTERARQEEEFFGSPSAPPACREVRQIEPGTLNTDETLQFLLSAGVDTVAVFGTNLVKVPLLDRWPGRMLNLHLGLSPYYRGTGTNFYPLLNEEPEYVGATIHLLDAGIDSGPIVGHARPVIEATDQPHTIGCKAIAAGVGRMILALHALEAGSLTTIPQWKPPSARLYLRKDYHPRQVVALYEKMENGLISRYVKRAVADRPIVRLVE